MAANPPPSGDIDAAITSLVQQPQYYGTTAALSNLLRKLDRGSSSSREAEEYMASFIKAVSGVGTAGLYQLRVAIDRLIEALDARYDARYAAIAHDHDDDYAARDHTH